MQINLMGYYGMNNIGDELMKANLIKYLQESAKFDRINVFCRKAPVNKLHDVRYFPLNNRSKWNKAFQLVKNKYTFWGGGTCLYQSNHSDGLFALMNMQKIVKLAGNKFGFLGIGVGNLKDDAYIQTAVKLLNNADFCYFRDAKSLDKAVKLAPNDNYCLGGDIVFLSEIMPIIKKSNDIKKISISAHYDYMEYSPELYGDMLNNLINHFNCKIYFLPAHSGKDHNDNIIHHKIADFLDKESYVICDWNDPDEYVNILSDMDFHIGVRLHSLVLADILGIPNIAISYSPKVESYIKKTKMLPDLRIINPDNCDIITVTEKVLYEYKRPDDFIESERISALNCLNRIFDNV